MFPGDGVGAISWKVGKVSTAWLQVSRPNEKASLRLFCFPFAGGTAQAYRGWSEHLPENIEVCAVQLPGREMRQREAPFSRAQDVVDAILPVLMPRMDRPFALFGHSMGAIIAFELARRLRQESQREPDCLIVSGRVAPHRPLTRAPINHVPREAFIEGLRHLNGTPAEVLDDSDLMNLIEPMLRADLAIHEEYRYQETPRLTCDILAFCGLCDPEAGRDAVNAWREVTDGSFDMRMVPGDHFFIRTAQALFLHMMSVELRQMAARLSNSQRCAS